MIIYGKNAIGKTIFSRALVDAGAHIGEAYFGYEDDYYLNAKHDYAKFRYAFQFDNDLVEYIYHKTDRQNLVYEKVILNEELLFEHDFLQPESSNFEGIAEKYPSLNTEIYGIVSVLSYVTTNTPLNTDNALRKTVNFIKGMHYAPLRLPAFQRRYSAPNSSINKEEVQEFESFLRDSGIDESLIVLKDNDGKERLYINKQHPLPFDEVASSGTKALLNNFKAYKQAEEHNTSLLIIDELDAFYHFELAEHIVKMFQKLKNTQVVFTSHNTNLLTNRFMRPDCCFIMTKNKLTSFPNATKMELREGHNLGKLFIGGEFDE
jgi:AAA15 family ATPase/GTPase